MKLFWLLLIPLCASAQSEYYLGMPVIPESDSRYERSLYGSGWIDADGDGQDTRQEVLAEESLGGFWLDRYTGTMINSARLLDIDHLVPLAEAHASGGYAWTREQRIAFANDLTNPAHLIAVSAGANRSKGDRDPAEWMPPNRAYWCEYLTNWVAVKALYGLSVDTAERDALMRGFDVCFRYLVGDSLDGRER